MSNSQDTEPSIDPRVRALLNHLRAIPPRDPEAEARGRAKYIAEVNELFNQGARPILNSKRSSPSNLQPKQSFTFATLRQSLAFTTLTVVLLIAFILFGGAGATAYAAQSSLPGDALYALKTGLEETQVRLSHDAARQAELHLDFAERRLVEIASLISQGRFEDIHTATSEFEAHVQQAIQSLEIVSAGDPARAKELTAHIAATLSSYTQVLQGMLTSVPDTVKPAVEKAILASRGSGPNEVEFEGTIEGITPDGWMISGKLVKATPQTEIKGNVAIGAMVQVHAVMYEDGSLTAREIEAVQNQGENLNDNVANSNTNDNIATDNSNDNSTVNENEGNNNDDSNSNSNDDQGEDNANQNSNENDDSGQNANNNDNDPHDDDENRNDNENDNLNENSDNQNDNDHDSGGHDNDNGGQENDNHDGSNDNGDD